MGKSITVQKNFQFFNGYIHCDNKPFFVNQKVCWDCVNIILEWNLIF